MLGNVTHDNYLLPTTLRHATNTGRGMGAVLQGIEAGWPGKTEWHLRNLGPALPNKPQYGGHSAGCMGPCCAGKRVRRIKWEQC